MSSHDPQRIELLADAVLGQLEAADTGAFTALLDAGDARAEFEALERTAALVGYATAREPSPTAAEVSALLGRLHADARAHFDAIARTRATRRPLAPLPWLVAAAACLQIGRAHV